MTGRRILAGLVVLVAIALLIGRAGAILYTDYLWYASLGAVSVWRARIATETALAVGSFFVAGFFVFLNLLAVRRSVVSLVLPRRIGNIEIGEDVPGKYLMTAVVIASVAVGAVLTFPADHWPSALLARVGRPFGESDPYFGLDLGFFVYWLPFESAVHVWAIIVLVAVIVLVIALYALTPSLRFERGGLHVSAYVRRHFTVLCAVILLVLAWSYRLGMYRLLIAGGGNGGLFTTVDRLMISAMLFLAVVTLCAAVVVAWAGWTGQMRLAFAAISVVLLFSLVSRTIVPLAGRRSGDPAARSAQERSYIATRLSYTRRAYGVDRMRAESLGTGFANAIDASTHVAIWDGATLASADRLRRVHVVGDAAGWQATPSGVAAVFVQHGSEGSSDSRDLWSIARFDATTADEHGLPERELSSSNVDERVLDEPAVFDSAPSYSVLSDSMRQLAGVEMVSTRSRLVHAWSLQNFRLLFGELPANRPVMVRRRDVRERVETLAPFLVQGSDVVPVVANDSLYWAIELYIASSSYPLAQRFTVLGEERGYFLHAATALVEAASGKVHLVADAAPDPVSASWLAYFPGLFVSAVVLPSALRAALPPLVDAAHAQALAFAAAGFRGDSLEVRHFAFPDGSDSTASREPARAIIPSFGGVSALWTLLDSAERVRGVVVAAGGESRVTSWIPLAPDGARWGSVVDRLRAADTLSRETGLVRARVRVLPVAGQPFYVQPTFQWRPGATPVLARVTESFRDSVGIGATLTAALGAGATKRAATPDSRLRADSLYRAVRSAMARGDWTAFGRAMDALGAALHVTIP